MSYDVCSICLEPLIHKNDGVLEPVGAALCGHCFHCECFWRWDESKRRQDWRRGVASRGCPCPVCNVPVMEFIKLFLNGDTSENERLRKELKLVKRRLARERAELEDTRQQLLKLTEPETETTDAVGTRRQMSESSRRTLEKDIQELCEAAALLLSCDSTSPKAKASSKPKQIGGDRPSYRRHESCPLQGSSSFPERGGNLELDPPLIHNSISMPPVPRSNRRSSQRRPDEMPTDPPRRRGEDAPNSRSIPIRTTSSRREQVSRGRSTPESHRPNGSQSVVVVRPDPPTPPMGINPADSFGNSHAYDRRFSVSPLSFDDPPSCRSRGDDSVAILSPEHPVNNAPTPNRRSPVTNFLGMRVDPPVGLLGGCIYID